MILFRGADLKAIVLATYKILTNVQNVQNIQNIQTV